MKRLAWLAVLTIWIPDTPTLAAPTPEEEGLLSMLEGRTGTAVRTLEGAAKATPVLRYYAGRVALAGRDFKTAQRLFTAQDSASLWGRIDVHLEKGEASKAATLALAEMDRALGGFHREALC